MNQEELDELVVEQKGKFRKKRRQQNVIALFTPADNCQANLSEYIETAKKLHGPMFEYGVEWELHTWDIRGFQSTTSLKNVAHAANVLFTRDNGLRAKQKAAKSAEKAFAKPFAAFAKAFITHRHNAKPKSHENHMVAISALRFLYEALPDSNAPCISQIVPEHFDMAIRSGMKKLASSTLYRCGVHLAEISAALDAHRLTPTLVEWENPIPRDDKAGGSSHNRGGKEAKLERAKKLPKTDVLIFLAALWNHYDDIDEGDKVLVCMSVILMLCGFRMDEFIGLDINCIPDRKEYEAQSLELDPETGAYMRVLRIRALAKKKAHWDEKIVPHCAVDIIYEAVVRLKRLSAPHRKTAQMMLEEHKWDRFSGFDDDEYLSARDVQGVLGMPGRTASNAISTMERYGVERDPDASTRKALFRVGMIHEGFCDAYFELISPIKEGFGHEGMIISVWEFLTLRYLDQYTPKERLNAFALPLTGTQVQDFFRGRDYLSRVSKKECRILSVFERYNFPELGKIQGTVRSHQFRHLLNTAMQESDMFSQEDIAKNFLRKGTQDNKAYNHQIEPNKYVERNRHIQDQVLGKGLTAGEAKNAIQKFPLLSYVELQQDLDESGSYHFMDIGRCRHDYTQGACGMHYMCLRECVNYRRTKNDPLEVEKITLRRDQAQAQMKLAKVDVDDEFEGANNWYLNHKELVDGCNAALAIEADDSHQPGDIVQIFPRGIDRCEEAG